MLKILFTSLKSTVGSIKKCIKNVVTRGDTFQIAGGLQPMLQLYEVT